MSYKIKETYYTIQGEGQQAGRTAVFVRFTGCNLWNGLEKDRANAICQFCDTDFWGTDGEGGGIFNDAQALTNHIISIRSDSVEKVAKYDKSLVVLTGGEPALQVDETLISCLHKNNFEVAIETNGTKPLPDGIDWICVSPKANTKIIIKQGNELKLVYPQFGLDPEQFEELNFDYFYLQPMDGPNVKKNTELCVQYCLEHPKWRLSLQWHKMIGIN